MATNSPSLARCLSADEAARAARFVSARDRARWIQARSFLRHVLAPRYVPVAPDRLRFDQHPEGKPFVRDSDVQFNLSHRGDAVAVAVSTGPVGVDVEMLDDGFERQAVADLVFHPIELADWRRGGATIHDFYRLWCAKEAVLKAEGTGFLTDPRALLATGWEGTTCRVRGFSRVWRVTALCQRDLAICVAADADDPEPVRIFMDRGFADLDAQGTGIEHEMVPPFPTAATVGG